MSELNNGMVDESATPAGSETKEQQRSQRLTKQQVMAANLAAVFGHGIGKVAAIAVGIVVVVLIAVAIRGLSGGNASEKGDSSIDTPRAPQAKVGNEAISAKELERRNQVSASEAEKAANSGQSYQTEFAANIKTDQTASATANGAKQPPMPFNGEQAAANGQPAATAQPGQQPVNGQPVQVTVAAGQTGQQQPQQNQGQTQQQSADQQKQQQELLRQQQQRDKYVEDIKKRVLADADNMMSGDKGGVRSRSGFSTVSYYQQPKSGTATENPSVVTGAGQGNQGVTVSTGLGGGKKGPPLIKTGKVMFATLDSEVNTDDGGQVFATIRGGPWNGSKLIGIIEQAPRNIRLRFTTLAPIDDRPTMSISALAIREADAKQGVAENIDNHTLERYGSLIFASIASGIGKAASMDTGTTVIYPNGSTVTQQDSMTPKRVAGIAIGEVGTNAAQEIRKNFNMPTTYSLPANVGVGVFFLNDVQKPTE